jgi:hypothetical protein
MGGIIWKWGKPFGSGIPVSWTLISVVGPFVHVDHLPVGYQGIN